MGECCDLVLIMLKWSVLTWCYECWMRMNMDVSYRVFVPETCIPYLSDPCTFLNCSVSTAVWIGGDNVSPPPLSYSIMLVWQTNEQVQNNSILNRYFPNPPQDCANEKSTWQNMERGGGYTTASSEILRKMMLILLFLISYLLSLISYLWSYLILRWHSCTKNFQWGVQFICPCTK